MIGDEIGKGKVIAASSSSDAFWAYFADLRVDVSVLDLHLTYT